MKLKEETGNYSSAEFNGATINYSSAEVHGETKNYDRGC